VKWVESRTENFQVTTHGRDHVQYVQMAARRDGTILGLKVRSVANLGAYLSTGGPGIPTGPYGKMLSGCYAMRGIRAEVLGVFTNTTPTDAYRGAGRPEATYTVERMVDILARRLDMDPAEIRRKNFIPKTAFPYEVCTGLTYDSGDYEAGLRKALEVVGYRRLREEQERARKEGRLLGIGLSSYVEICGIGPGGGGGSEIRVEPSGKVRVYTGAHPHGQGEETSIAQIVADELGVPLDSVEVLHGDTETTPWGIGTFGSRGLAVEGAAALKAAQEVKRAAQKLAAHLLEAREEDVVIQEGRAFVPDAPEQAYTLGDLARIAEEGALAEGLPRRLDATAFYDPENYVFPFGTHVCVVEVDRETGQVELLRYVAVDDCGVVVNPLLVEGQIRGGVLQGLAQALWEEARYDEEGNLLTSSFMEYLMPTAAESPRMETHRTVTPSPHNPLGAKGVGEAGTIGSIPAVVNAVVDALAPCGVIHLDMPLTAEKVWRAVHGK
jgi:carbon-monoxide dehydrogenase large subunit